MVGLLVISNYPPCVWLGLNAIVQEVSQTLSACHTSTSVPVILVLMEDALMESTVLTANVNRDTQASRHSIG